MSMPPTAVEAAELPLEIVDAEPLPRDFKPEPAPRRQYVAPPITGDDAIVEAARINRELGVYDRKALPPGRF